MPNVKTEREVSNDGVNKVIEVDAAAGGGTKDKVLTQYTVPATAGKFQEMILGLSASPDGGAFVKSIFGKDREDQNESPLDYVYRSWVAHVDRAARMAVYKSTQTETTIITVGKDKIDIMTFPVGKLVNGINQLRGYRQNQLLMLGVTDENAPEHEHTVEGFDRKVNFRQFETAARRLVDDRKARENNGVLELVA